MISFFLKTLKAHEATPVAATFEGLGMRNDGNEDDGSIAEETISSAEDVRAELNQRFDQFAADVTGHTNNMRDEIRNDMNAMFNTFFQQMQQHLQQQRGGGGNPQPDLSGSSQ